MIGTMGARRRALLPMVGLMAGLTGLAGLGACDDNDDNLVAVVTPTAVVTTFKDSTFNFTTLHTFAMPDTVVHFAPVTGTPIAVTREFDRVALDRVRADLIARGYTEVIPSPTLTPSFVVLVGATATTNYNAFVGYSWFSTWGFYSGWAWYAPGFNTSWGIVYPWYGVVGVTSYDRGTLLVDIIPTLSVNPLAKSVRSAWVGAATALLNGTVTAAGVTAAIDEMFRQSPYLTASATVASR